VAALAVDEALKRRWRRGSRRQNRLQPFRAEVPAIEPSRVIVFVDARSDLRRGTEIGRFHVQRVGHPMLPQRRVDLLDSLGHQECVLVPGASDRAQVNVNMVQPQVLQDLEELTDLGRRRVAGKPGVVYTQPYRVGCGFSR